MTKANHDPTTSDPIIALVEAHKRSLLERDSALAGATSAAEEDATDPLFERETKDIEALMRAEPATIAGLYAMISHLADYAMVHQLPDGPEQDLNGSTTQLLATLSRALDKIRSAS